MSSNKQTNLEKLIDKIIFFKDSHDQYYIEKYCTNWILSRIGDNEEIKIIEQKFKEYDQKAVDLIDFVRILLSIIDHSEEQTLYIVMGAIDLFKEICESFNTQNAVSSADLVNYIVEVFLQKTTNADLLQTRKIPEQKKFDIDSKRVREIDINAPVIIGDLSSAVRRLIKNKIITDSYHHNNNGITRAYYANEIKKVFTLDSLSGNISLYNLSCIREKIIKPKISQDKREIIILDFAWSNRQNRLGCCLKDFTLCFWDANDNFEFEKTFNISNLIYDYQTNIWYIEFLNIWITTDKSHAIHGWDIEKETKQFSLTSNKIKQNIIDIIGIDYLKLVAVSSMDRAVTIWDFTKGSIVVHIDLKKGGIHSIVFSKTYQSLITAGYENTISLWGINPTFLDQSLIGKLIGHSSMVTAVQVVEKSPMIISADDSGDIKVWDIRTMNCVQTIELGNRTMITRLIDISEWNKLCFVGSRVNFLEYDLSYNDSKNVLKNNDPLWPIRVDYNFLYKELIVCTRRDLRYIDVETGRIKKIIVGLLENDDDDITKFRLVQQNKKFILGDHRGNLGLYLYSTGEKVKDLNSHTHEVTGLKVDYVNKLIITASWDATIFIQKETKTGSQVKRKLLNLHYGKEISLLELSVYHNIMITSTSNNILYIWDYEFGKLISSITLEEGSEPTCIQFLNGYSVVIIADNMGKIHFIQFSIKDITHIKMRRIGYLHINDINIKGNKDENTFLTENQQYNNTKHFNMISFANRLLIDINYNELEPETKKPSYCKIYISTNKGDVKVYDLMIFFKNNYLEFTPHSNTRSNYNAERQCAEDFEKAVLNLKIYNFSVEISDEHKKNNNTGHDKALFMVEKEIGFDDWENKKITQEINMANYLTLSFQAHKDSLTTLSLMLCPENRLLTSSLDGYIKIWELDSKLIGSYNINHPLPMLWNLKFESVNKSKKRILYAMKVIETLLRRYQSMLTLKEEKRITINKFLLELENGDKDNGIDSTAKILYSSGNRNNAMNSSESPERYGEKKILLMRDEYSPRDLQYEKIKKIYQEELQGPNLKQMENTKRLIMAQKMWKEAAHREKESGINHEDTKEKYANFMNYLLGDQKILFNEDNSKQAGLVGDLSKKLDKVIKKKDKDKVKQVSMLENEKSTQLKNSSKYNSNKSIGIVSKCSITPNLPSTLGQQKVRKDSISSMDSDDLDNNQYIKRIQKSKGISPPPPQALLDEYGGSGNGSKSNLQEPSKLKNKIKQNMKLTLNPDSKKNFKPLTRSPTRTDLKKTGFIFEYASQKMADYVPHLTTDDLKASVFSRSNTESILFTRESQDRFLTEGDVTKRYNSKGGYDRKGYHSELNKLLGALNDRLKQSIRGTSLSTTNKNQLQKGILKKDDILASMNTESTRHDTTTVQLPKIKNIPDKGIENTIKTEYGDPILGNSGNIGIKETTLELPKINFKEEINKLRIMLKNTHFETIDKEEIKENPKSKREIKVNARDDINPEAIDDFFATVKVQNDAIAEDLEHDLIEAGLMPETSHLPDINDLKHKISRFKYHQLHPDE